jgi:hypothetical protein
VEIRQIDRTDEAALTAMYAVAVASQSLDRPFFTPAPLESTLADLRHAGIPRTGPRITPTDGSPKGTVSAWVASTSTAA